MNSSLEVKYILKGNVNKNGGHVRKYSNML